jgi:hypothetical protein
MRRDSAGFHGGSTGCVSPEKNSHGILPRFRSSTAPAASRRLVPRRTDAMQPAGVLPMDAGADRTSSDPPTRPFRSFRTFESSRRTGRADATPAARPFRSFRIFDASRRTGRADATPAARPFRSFRTFESSRRAGRSDATPAAHPFRSFRIFDASRRTGRADATPAARPFRSFRTFESSRGAGRADATPAARPLRCPPPAPPPRKTEDAEEIEISSASSSPVDAAQRRSGSAQRLADADGSICRYETANTSACFIGAQSVGIACDCVMWWPLVRMRTRDSSPPYWP